MERIDKYELPIETENIPCVTDCWIYNRLIIIKTSKYYTDWIVSHYNLFSKLSNYDFNFGETGLTEPNYHDDILARKQIKIFKVSKDKIVEKLTRYLLKGYYINIYIKNDTENASYHEVVIYGFDDFKKCFSAVRLKNRRFERFELAYSYLVDTWQEVQEFFYNNQTNGLHLSMVFQHPATLFKLKKTYIKDNCTFEAYKKLRKELYGTELKSSSAQEYSQFNNQSSYYTGIACLNVLDSMITQIIDGTNRNLTAHNVIRAAKKLFEHRQMLLVTMQYVYDKWNVCMNTKAANLIKEYEGSCRAVERWLMLALRYDKTNNKNCLKMILEEVPVVYNNERAILNNFINNSIDWKIFNKKFI